MMVLGIFLVCTLAWADVPIYLNTPFYIQAGGFARLEDEDLLITFLEIVEDSLCPPGARCMWAGAAVIRIKVTRAETEEEYQLAYEPGNSSYNGIPRTVTVGGYTVEFVSLEEDAAALTVFKKQDEP